VWLGFAPRSWRATQPRRARTRYGRAADATTEKALAAGSFYSEPAGVAHFAETSADPVVVYITGFGPTDTIYVMKSNDPHRN
jgi:hypothetical protein